jgi:NAD(P)H-flavin reductase
MREYSVYSSPGDEYLEILVKEVDGGYVSTRLGALKPGDGVAVDGPFGFFTIDEDWRDHRYVFVATGTGISPFHDFVRSYPGNRLHAAPRHPFVCRTLRGRDLRGRPVPQLHIPQ